jgi:hypothetical protein
VKVGCENVKGLAPVVFEQKTDFFLLKILKKFFLKN